MSRRSTTRIVGLLILLVGLLAVVWYVNWPRSEAPVVDPELAAKEKEWQAANAKTLAETQAALTELAALGIYMQRPDGQLNTQAEYKESDLSATIALRLSREPKLTPEVIALMRRIPKLAGIEAYDTALDDTGLALLSQLENLRDLNLNYTLVSDVGLVHLSKLPQLRVLDLNGTKVSDASAAVFAQLQTLERVSLFETQVGDEVLASLATLEKLKAVDVQATRVSLERTKSFAPKREQCTLTADPY